MAKACRGDHAGHGNSRGSGRVGGMGVEGGTQSFPELGAQLSFLLPPRPLVPTWAWVFPGEDPCPLLAK